MSTSTIKLPEKPMGNSLKKTLIWVTVISIIVWGFSIVDYPGFQLTAQGFAKNLWNDFTNPDIEYLLKPGEEGILYKMLQTVAIAVAGTFVSGILAIPLALMASQNIVAQRVAKTGKVVITMIRTFPELILALMFVRIVGPGAPAGIMAIGIHSIGMLGKLFSEAIESMDIGVKEAIESCGGSKMEILFRAVLPQVMPEFISYTLFRFEINMRAATILGLVAAGGIGYPLIINTLGRNWDKVFVIIFLFIVTVTIIDTISTKIRKKLV